MPIFCGIPTPRGRPSSVKQLPEGRYWFHAGVPKNAARKLTSGFLFAFTFGAGPIDLFDYPSAKKILSRPVDEFFPVDVKKGQTHYIVGVFSRDDDHLVKGSIRSGGTEDGEGALESTYNHFFYLRDLSPKVIHRLQAEPNGIQKRRNRQFVLRDFDSYVKLSTAGRLNSVNAEGLQIIRDIFG